MDKENIEAQLLDKDSQEDVTQAQDKKNEGDAQVVMIAMTITAGILMLLILFGRLVSHEGLQSASYMMFLVSGIILVWVVSMIFITIAIDVVLFISTKGVIKASRLFQQTPPSWNNAQKVARCCLVLICCSLLVVLVMFVPWGEPNVLTQEDAQQHLNKTGNNGHTLGITKKMDGNWTEYY